MTDPQTNAPPPPLPSTSRGVKIALAVSVALNLAVAGLAAGAWLRDGPRGGMPRDMSFGPFSEALDDADRKSIRRSLLERVGEFREQRKAAKAEFEALLVALRAEPFRSRESSARSACIPRRLMTAAAWAR